MNISENTEKGIFSYNCKSMLKAKEVDGDITKFDYDAYSVLNQITKPNADELDFDFDMLGRLRKYETSNRESAFDMDGTKRLGDFEDKTDEWRRYHWCKQHLLGYKDDSNTYYFLTEPDGSVEVIFTHAGTTVNRLEYDFLGKLRNQTTTPQVELLWRGSFCNNESELYIDFGLYNPMLGKSIDEYISLHEEPTNERLNPMVSGIIGNPLAFILSMPFLLQDNAFSPILIMRDNAPGPGEETPDCYWELRFNTQIRRCCWWEGDPRPVCQPWRYISDVNISPGTSVWDSTNNWWTVLL